MSDYTIRPNKSIVRKIIFDALQRLSSSQFPLGDYTYIGLGSVSFTDFIEAHHALGIDEMISFERKPARYRRAEYSKPYSCIRVIEGDTRSEIPGLDSSVFDDPALLWLDYEGTLEGSNVLDDIELICNRLDTRSVVITTINASAGWITNETQRREKAVTEIREIVNNEHMTDEMKLSKIRESLPGDQTVLEERRKYLTEEFDNIIDEDTLKKYKGDNISEIYKNAINRKYENELINQGRTDVKFRQIFDIEYEDTSQMLVVGGIFLDEDYSGCLDNSRLWDTPHLQEDDQTMVLVPRLTRKEKIDLDQFLPVSSEDKYYNIEKVKLENPLFFSSNIDSESLSKYWGVIDRKDEVQESIKGKKFDQIDCLDLIHRHFDGLSEDEVKAYTTFYSQYPVFKEVRH